MRPVNLKNIEFTGLRGQIARFVEHPYTIRFISIIIMINAVTLGLETNDKILADYGSVLALLDRVFIMIFLVEILAKLSVYRLHFFRAGWNVFDFSIVAISLFPASGAFSILRAFRIFRILRLLSVVPQMRTVIAALLVSIPGMTSIISVLLLIFYVSAVLATQLFGGHEAPEIQAMFGSIGDSMYTLFQIMTLEGWSENVAEPTMVYFPWSWLFFVPFIVITSFAVLNLFIGIIVDAMNIVHQSDLEEEGQDIVDQGHTDSEKILAEMKSLRKEITALKTAVKKISS